MKQADILRVIDIIKESIAVLKIDLSGQNVLTEAGSGYFLFTPIIARLAGAEKVFIWTKDSSYGNAKDIYSQFNEVLNILNLPNDFIWALNHRPVEHIQEADIITNLGFVRPINDEFLSLAKKNKAVVPLMCEAWELRENDVDISSCKYFGIKVAGTWENIPTLKIFDACGSLAIKIANEAGYEVYQNKIIIWSDDNFGEVIKKSFINHGAKEVICTTDFSTLLNNIEKTDFIFICKQSEKKAFFGEEGIIDVSEIIKINKRVGIIHIYGDIDNEYVKKMGLNIYPDRKGRSNIMTYTLSHLGPIPIINLHAAGLKVGELLIKNEKNDLVQLI